MISYHPWIPHLCICGGICVCMYLVLIPGDVYVYHLRSCVYHYLVVWICVSIPDSMDTGIRRSCGLSISQWLCTVHLVVSSIPPSHVLYTQYLYHLYQVSVRTTDILPSHEVPRLGACVVSGDVYVAICSIWLSLHHHLRLCVTVISYIYGIPHLWWHLVMYVLVLIPGDVYMYLYPGDYVLHIWWYHLSTIPGHVHHDIIACIRYHICVCGGICVCMYCTVCAYTSYVCIRIHTQQYNTYHLQDAIQYGMQ